MLQSAYHRAWKQKKIEMGLCSKCGVNPHAENRKLCQICLDDGLIRARAYQAANPEKRKIRLIALKTETFNRYGGCFCVCCGENDLRFLSLDHIENDGAAHRKAISGKSQGFAGEKIYMWLRKNNYPAGFQVLCMNCNFGKMVNGGICPHQEFAKKLFAVA